MLSMTFTRESETSGDSGHGSRDEMVEIAVCWCCKFQCPKADVIESLVVDAVGFISVLN